MEKSERADEILREVRGLNDRLRRLEERVEGLLAVPGEGPRGAYLRSHVDGLDDALGGGIPTGSILLITGRAGSGKTALALSILGGNDGEGHRSLYLTVEEGRESVAKSLGEMGVGGDGMVVDVSRLRREHPEVDGVGNWLPVVEGFVARRRASQGVSTVAVDPFSTLLDLSNLTQPRAELFHFFSRLRALGVTTLLLYDGPFRHGEDALADGVLRLRVEERAGNPEVHLTATKLRHTRGPRVAVRLENRGGRLVARPIEA